MLLALDIGNTNITLGVFEGEQLRATWRLSTDASKMPDEYGVMLVQMLQLKNLVPEDVDAVSMCSVVHGSRFPSNDRSPDIIRPPEVPQNGDSNSAEWDKEIDQAWASRDRSNLTGPAAASDAAKVLGAQKLSLSKFPSLEKLLGASNFLRSKWRREGNRIIKK